MAIRRAFAISIAATALALVSTAAVAAVQPYQTNDPGGFRNILPAGTHGVFNGSDITQFECCGTYPPHATDQLSMYENLVYATPGLTAAQVPNFYKDASFGVQSGHEERTYSPRAGLTIVRDSDFGVPHIYGDTRSDVMFGTGYVGAEDRLFFMDVLRHSGRAQLSGFAGGSNKAMDADVWSIAPYTEADLQMQIDRAAEVYGTEGAQLVQDLSDYVDGVNQYISEARTDVNKMPGEYAAIGKTLEDWKRTDVIATAALIGGIFGKGGGNEVGNALVLQDAKGRYGGAAGDGAWRDFRRQDDPEAPTTVQSSFGSFDYPKQRGSAGVALPDEGSLVNPPNSSGPANADGLAGLLGGFGGLGGASNALLVSASKSESGHPVAVMGPQVAYFMPEILLEEDLHGPDIDANGASFPGVNPYVLLGRGRDFAWSATSAGQDIIDTFAEKLCEPDGSAPNVQSTHYLWKGDCLPMEILTRVNNITPNAGDPSPPETYTLEAQRTVHGIVYKRGTVDGDPVAFVRQRSTYFHEADSARAFSALNRPSQVQNVEDFQHVMSKINFTFNWFYADDKDIGYFNSGDNPVRAAGADPDLPNWGTGEYDWQGFNTDIHTADYTPFAEHPQVVNQPVITSWNNKQAAGYDAADDNYAYGPTFRSQSLDEQIQQRTSGSDKMSLPELIDSMEVAGTVDLRGTHALPLMLQVIGTPSDPQLAGAVSVLQNWLNAGAHRRDLDNDDTYDDELAVKIMDAWWPRAVEAEFKPEMGTQFFNAVHNMMEYDNNPHGGGDADLHGGGDHLGSSYIDGWYGYVSKDLRRILGQPTSDPFSRTYCGSGSLTACRDALRQSLADAVTLAQSSNIYDEDTGTAGNQRVAGCPSNKTDQWCWDSIHFRVVGAVSARTIHWRNRPTFQQAVEVQGHRPRGYPRPKGATPLRAALVAAYKGCSSPNRTHGAPLSSPSCSPPQQRSDYLTMGTLDANSQPAKFVGSVRYSAIAGDTGTVANEADVGVDIGITDVRKKTDLSDYAGQLSAQTTARITDRNNSGAGGSSDPATASDVPFPITVPCAATTDTTIGGSCSISTSFNAILPNSIRENDRSNWQLDQVLVFDGGADGQVSTSPNTLFARQGIFIP
jgi:acyl-homoserine lactone acylase PvdQ